ncbi:hypothetical protein GCM10023196_049320 [Actinoallomurus vinaceus]|uniref:Tetratricopeptide repeat protein n=1 Tax=Actinoallomurus vinaceus TaxID=1080074 RepID=A0ABP8UCY8_9ACTN
MTIEPSPLPHAWELYRAGDVQGALRILRRAADALPPAELAPLVRELASASGFDDLAQAAAALVADPEGARQLYDFGYACVERGVSALAVPALCRAMVHQPGRRVLVELAVALEDQGRHAEAVELLQEHDGLTVDWPDRYLLVYNALFAGRLEQAREVFAGLSDPDESWAPTADRIRRILARAAAVPPVDRGDLRGWHYTLTGGLLTTLSSYGFQQGMTGRWAYLQDTFDSCRHGLERLRVALTATGRRPSSVALLPDRDSRILGLAAAQVLGVPTQPYRPGTPDVLVVAYDLDGTDPELRRRLRDRAPGEVLYEHATCWTNPPAVTADVSTLLVRSVVAPWAARMRVTQAHEPERLPADERPAAELADAICTAAGGPDAGDGGTPADPDEVLAAFATRARDTWLTGPRDQVRSPGPVPSSRFA